MQAGPTGFTGTGGFAMASLLGDIRRTMLTGGVPAVLSGRQPAGTV